MPSRSGLFVAFASALFTGAVGCGLLFDYSDYKGASSASGSGGTDATSSAAGTGGVTSTSTSTSASSSAAGTGGGASSSSSAASSSAASSSASGADGGPGCAGVCMPDPMAGAKYVYRAPAGTCGVTEILSSYDECTACSCGASAGTCTLSAVHFYDDAACATGRTIVTPSVSCVAAGNKHGVVASVAPDGDGSCMPLKATTGSTPVTLCEALPSAACSGGSVCAPNVLSSNKLCRLYPSSVVCPSGFDVRTLVYPGNGGSCTCLCSQTCGQGAMTLYSMSMCAGVATDVPLDGACHASAAAIDGFITPTINPPATCANNQYLANGTPQTLCCVP